MTEASTQWDEEGIWNAVFGPHETRETVLADADSGSVTPQDYAMSSIVAAIGEGADFDKGEAFDALCDALGPFEALAAD